MKSRDRLPNKGCRSLLLFVTIMGAALYNLNSIVQNAVYQSIFFIDSPAPLSSWVISQRFRFAKSIIAVSNNIPQ